jgi:hypothetical protein
MRLVRPMRARTLSTPTRAAARWVKPRPMNMGSSNLLSGLISSCWVLFSSHGPRAHCTVWPDLFLRWLEPVSLFFFLNSNEVIGQEFLELRLTEMKKTTWQVSLTVVLLVGVAEDHQQQLVDVDGVSRQRAWKKGGSNAILHKLSRSKLPLFDREKWWQKRKTPCISCS